MPRRLEKHSGARGLFGTRATADRADARPTPHVRRQRKMTEQCLVRPKPRGRPQARWSTLVVAAPMLEFGGSLKRAWKLRRRLESHGIPVERSATLAVAFAEMNERAGVSKRLIQRVPRGRQKARCSGSKRTRRREGQDKMRRRSSRWPRATHRILDASQLVCRGFDGSLEKVD